MSAESQPGADGRLWSPPEGVEPEYALARPRAFYSTDEVERGRTRDEAWARQVRERVRRRAEDTRWIEMSSTEIRETIPDRGALYTVTKGKDVERCPICGADVEVVGWSAPGVVECKQGHRLPDEEHPDDGSGYEAPDGEMCYFRAQFNCFVIDQATDDLETLGRAFAITGADRFAETAVAILDAIAAIYPTAIEGPIGRGAPGEEGGRLNRPGYQVARDLVTYAEAADLVWEHAAMAGESAANPGANRREHVAHNLLLNGADFCERFLQKGYDYFLANGTADYVRGMLAVGATLGVDRYVEWAIDSRVSLEYMLANNVDRDGTYYESAAMYAHHARRLYVDLADLCYHLPEDRYPEALDAYQEPRFQRLLVGHWKRNCIAGRLPRYGDSGPEPDTEILDLDGEVEREAPDTSELSDNAVPEQTMGQEGAKNLVRIHARTQDPSVRREVAKRLTEMTDGDIASALVNTWQVCNVESITTRPESPPDETGSQLLGGSGRALLRPQGGTDRGVHLRYGPSLNHGHADELGINLYAAGREVSFDPGYGSSHYRAGWCRQTVAHWTAVVDEEMQIKTDSPGGHVHAYRPGPECQLLDVSDTGAYPDLDIEEYRRTVAMIDLGEDHSYYVDLFRIAGGSVTDYSFHALGQSFESTLDPGPAADGSLASPDIDWGSAVRGDGKTAGDGKVPDFEDERVPFNPPPGNGYGFLSNPRRDDRSTFSATWTDERTPPARTRLRMLDGGEEAIVADAPKPMSNYIDADARIPYVLARDRSDGGTTYAAVLEAGEQLRIEDATRLPADGGEDDDVDGSDPAAVKIEHDLGTDLVASVPGPEATSFEGDVETDATMAVVRRDENGIRRARMVGGSHLSAPGVTVTGCVPQRAGTITAAGEDDEGAWLDVRGFPDEGALNDAVGYVESSAYTHNSPYRIDTIESGGDTTRIRLKAPTLVLSKGRLESAPEGNVLPNAVALSLARLHVRGNTDLGTPNSYFEGKLVRGDGGSAATIEEVIETTTDGPFPTERKLRVDDASDFAAGEEIAIHDVRPDDQFRVPTTLTVARSADGMAVDAPCAGEPSVDLDRS